MSGIITTYRNIDFSNGSKYDATKENFPCCSHFFKCNEVAGVDTNLTDAITGETLGAGLTITNPSSGSVDTNVTSGLSGSGLVSPGTKSVVALVVGNITLLGVVFGSAAGTHLTISGSVTGSQVQGDDGLKSLVALSGGGVFGAGFKYELTTPEATAFEMDDASGYVEKAATPLGLTSTVAGMTNIISLAGGNTEIFGIGLFYFDSLPADVKQAVAWMTEAWRAGNKEIYPAWRGLT